jgi:2-dehydro-3-deoxyphosphooctonate aldolase (KDO 8-P synthase)
MNLAGIELRATSPFFLIAGPCVIEDEALTFGVAESLRSMTDDLAIPWIFKASFRKANRSSLDAYSGPGLERGLRILERIRDELAVPILTDVHEDTPLDEVADVVDVLQTPAFLCRQTSFIVSVASRGLPVNIKKGQFLSPAEMHGVVEKARSTGNERLLVCERGTTFGYNDLVVDMRALVLLRETGCPVVFDATHSVQRPGLLGTSSGGDREFVPALARAAVGVGIAGLFVETHPDPDRALCDGPTSWPLGRLGPLLAELGEIDAVVKAGLEPEFARSQE